MRCPSIVLFVLVVLFSATAASAYVMPRPSFFPSAFRDGLTGAAISGSDTSSIQGPDVRERIQCVFYGANGWRSCRSDKVGCKGKENCVLTSTGKKGETVVWKSNCVGAQTVKTVIDGKDKLVEFKCASGLSNGVDIVTCVFDGAVFPQRCRADRNNVFCDNRKSCTTRISGKLGDKVTWTSTCPGSSKVVTTLNGSEKEVRFDCTRSGDKPTGVSAAAVAVPTVSTPVSETVCVSGEYRLTGLKDGHYFGSEKCVDGMFVTV
ncbi:MAG: hypothetical protein AABX47_03740 [Nanoarchaeota archaeon]